MPLRRRNAARAAAVAGCVAMVAAACWHWRNGGSRSAAPTPTEPADVTFATDVAPIVFEKCASCHRPGEAGPFSLLTPDDVRRRAKQIVDVTQSRYMPPWMPAAGQGDFAGARRLSDRELAVFKRWEEAGAPAGDAAQMPTPPSFADGWQTGPPHLVLESPPYTLASQERDVFRNFVVPVPLEEPRWVESIELRPTNPRVTHHARLGVDSSNESVRRDAEDPAPGYAGMAWAQDPDGQLVIWAPGMLARGGTPGVAWRMYPRSALVLHTHMQPSGKSEVVQFKIGIHFAKEAPTQRPVIMRIGSCDIDIPAGMKHHVVSDSYTLPIEVEVQTIFPHAHSLCREVRVVAEKPDGTREPLIAIDAFDENWHDSYRYRNPVRLPKGTRLVSTFAYDNSDGNVRNRNHPPRRVVYGSNAEDEMADVYLQVTATHPDQRAVLMEDLQRYELRSQLAGYRKALEMRSDEPFMLEGLATCYVGTGETQKAIATWERRIAAGPKAVYPVVGLGMALLAKGDAGRAEAELKRALGMDGEYPLAWYGLGQALGAQKKTEEAEKAYRRAIELAPGSLDARLSLSDSLMKRGELEEAARECAAALNDSPEAAGVHVKLAEIYARQGSFEQSLDQCRKARQIAPYTHPAKVLLAVNCLANGEAERGIKLLDEAKAEEAQHPMAPLMLGQLARRRNDTAAARERFAEAAARPIPENWPESHRQRFLVSLHSERLQLAEQLQDLGMAKDALVQWMKVEPENQRLRAMYEQLSAGGGR